MTCNRVTTRPKRYYEVGWEVREVATDGAQAMTGRYKGFIACLKIKFLSYFALRNS